MKIKSKEHSSSSSNEGAQKEIKGKNSTPSFRVVDKRFFAKQGGEEKDEEESKKVPSYVEKLENIIAEKDKKIQDAMLALKKLQDDQENFKIRLRKDASKEIEQGRRAVLQEILPVVDNFDRALESAKQNRDFDSLLEGLILVRNQLIDILGTFGVKRMESLGKKFDPKLHEVITQVPVNSEDEDGMVAGVINEGYFLGDMVLRPARVAVGKYEKGDGINSKGYNSSHPQE